MTFFTIVERGLIRRPVRTGLTLVGISIGIAAVVALVGLASGYEKSMDKQLDVMGVDIVVSNMSGGFLPKVFDESLQARIAKLPGVAETTSVLMEIESIEDAPMMMVSGRQWGGFTWGKLNLMTGRMPRDGAEHAVILGRMAAEVLKKKSVTRCRSRPKNCLWSELWMGAQWWRTEPLCFPSRCFRMSPATRAR